MSIAYYMDVHVPASVTDGLHRRRIDVLTSQEDESQRADDESLLRRATELDRVLFTQDDDLLMIAPEWQSANREFTGIVFAHQLGPGIGLMIDDLELLALAAEPGEIRNRVTYLPLK